MPDTKAVTPVTLNSGIVHAEEEDLFQPVLCKPKLMPLKSVTLQHLEDMQRLAEEKLKQQQQELEKETADTDKDEQANSNSNQYS